MDRTETGERFSDAAFPTIEEGGRSYGIFLPDPDDHIQKSILRTGKPYELEMLRDMRMRLEPGDLVCDIGANVGSHTLYLAAVARARVIAFEPNAHLAEAITASVARNSLEERVEVRAHALGTNAGTASFARIIPDNLGAQALTLGRGGIEVESLDTLRLEGPVRAVKIDVEGMEIDVLKGAAGLIDRDRPLLYVECQDAESFREVAHFTQEHGYTCWETFNVTPTHLFLPMESVSVDQRLEALKTREVAQEYRFHTSLKRSKRALATAERQVKEGEKARAELIDVKAELATRTAEAARLEVRLLDLEAKNGRLAASIRTRFEELAALTRMLETEKDARLQDMRKYRDEIKDLEKKCASLLGYGRKIERRHAEVLDSRSWRVLEPLRRAMRLVRRKPAPKRFSPRLGRSGVGKRRSGEMAGASEKDHPGRP